MNQQKHTGAALAAEPEAEPNVRRWTEQRWLVDNIIRANGIDWDQPRSFYMNAACGIEASADFAAIRQRIQKYADITARSYDELMPMFSDDGRFNPKALAVLAKSYVELKVLPEEPDPKLLYTDAFLPVR